MDIKILILFAAFAHFLLGFLVIRKNYKNTINISFAIFSWVFSGWSLSLYLYEHPLFFSSLFWIKVVYLFVILMISTILHFSYFFPNRHTKYLNISIGINIIFSLFLFYILFFTNSWVEAVYSNSWGYETKLGDGFKIFQLNATFFSIIIFYNLIKGYKKSTGLGKMQAKYMLLGMIVLTLLMVPVNILLPLLTGDSRYFWLSPILSLSFIGITTYSIIRYRLMDIRLIIKKSLTYFLTIITLMMIMVLLFVGLGRLFFKSELIHWDAMIYGVIIFGIGLIFFNKIITFFQRFTDRFLYKNIYSYQEALKKLSTETTTIIELDKLVDMIVDTLMKSMGLNRAGVLLADKKIARKAQKKESKKAKKEIAKKEIALYRITKTIGFNETNGISLVQDNFLTDYLQKIKQAIVYEEIELMIRDSENKTEKKHLENLRDNMARIEAGVCLPLFSQRQLIGLIVLGNKISGEAYTEEDLQLLNTLANQASVAISNARLYKEVEAAHRQAENFNKILQKEVDLATVELIDKNKNLQELLKMKSEFLTIASHQLRTPTSIVRGILSMLREDSDKLEPEQRVDFLDQAFASINHLERIIRDLLSATELEGGKMKFVTEPINFVEAVEKVINERKPLAAQKKVELIHDLPKDFPKILADHYKLEEVIGNLIDNGIYYTPKGSVTIKLSHDNKYAKLSVIDTGIGIEKDDKKILFERFKRGKNIIQIHPNGSGLGLYIVKGVIEALSGKLKVESAGKDKGSTFLIFLPLVK